MRYKNQLIKPVYWLLAVGILLAAGCAPAAPASPTATLGPKEVPPDSTPATPPPGPPLEVTAVTTTQPLPPNPSLDDLVDAAIQDLASRLSIPTTSITLVESREVDWTDASLGCPQPGMGYAQVITPGFLVLLDAGGTQYEYHAGRQGPIFLCENPVPPAAGGVQ